MSQFSEALLLVSISFFVMLEHVEKNIYPSSFTQ